MACAADAAALDEVHLLRDKLAVIQHDRPVEGGLEVGALFYTTLLGSSPKLMLNADVGDYGTLHEQRCGCPFEQIGMGQHLRDIRSYDKLTSEGMTFAGDDFLHLIEEVLPERFGGRPTDYQFVEQEEAGLSKVSLVVSPRVPRLDEAQLTAVVLAELTAASAAAAMMAERWRQGRTLRVVRAEPYSTHAAKVLPLHVTRERS
jgi:hypothetical protein